ncbi:MAG: glycosyltransferase family 2 protein [Anaerolineales bacterium]
MTPDLSIIIVSWNVREMLRECLASIARYHGVLRVQIIVVDSASTDGSAAMVRADFPDVLLLAQAENIGFVRGNNLGLEHATGRYVLLLNPDTRVHAHALGDMVGYLDAHPEYAILGPHTLNTDGTHQSTRRRFPSLALALFESTAFQGLAPRGLLRRFYAQDLPDEGTFPVDWVQGSALLARRTVYEAIGGLDPAFVMFFEELDWCKRAAAAGFGAVYLGAAYITHHGGGSTAQVSARKHTHFQFSKLRYFRKHHGRPAAWLLRAVIVLSYGLQTLIEGAKLAVGHKRDLRAARIRVYGQLLHALTIGGEAREP